MRSNNTFDAEALKDRVAVVTGANGGIGQAIAYRLQAMGAQVVKVDISFAQKPTLVDGSWQVSCDIAQASSVEAMAELVRERLGSCDVLVNNAAISAPPVSLEHLPHALWDRMLDINLRGALLCAQALVPMMFASAAGSIVNISSIAAQVATRAGAYGTAKAGMQGLTHQMAVEWGPRGVRANSVSPGMIRTPLSEAHYREEGVLNKRISRIPMRQIGQPEDIADAVAFLSSDGARYVNGQDLVVDGGFLKASLANLY